MTIITTAKSHYQTAQNFRPAKIKKVKHIPGQGGQGSLNAV
jgi:hypothetical protein